MKEIFEYVLNALKSRITPLILAFVLMFSMLIGRVFTLQIVEGQKYSEDLSNSIMKTSSVPATRGRIYDRNGVLLAYNELAFAVKFTDNETYKNNQEKNKTVNASIAKAIQIVDENGDKIANDFQIMYTDNVGYSFNISGNSLLRFKRDIYGKKKIADMSEEETNSTAEDIINVLCDKYEVNKEEYPKQHLLKLLSVRFNMTANSYNRSIPFTIANEVSDATVAAILENSSEFTGISVDQQYIRKYVDSLYCSQILGYTGTISQSELETFKEDDESYEANDIVGKAGIEQSMESELRGTKGSKTVYVDNVGRITQVVSEEDSGSGNDVYLTIDVELQKKIYQAIEDELVSILLNHITQSDTKYTYLANGDTDVIYTTIKEVYFALIDNNLISLDKVATKEHDTEEAVYNEFLSKKDNILNWVEKELMTDSTKYGNLSEERKAYIWYIYKNLLLEQNIIDSNAIDTSDDLYKSWVSGSNVSMTDFLKYCITKNWINMSELSSQQYTSLQESYEELVKYILNTLDTDKEFHKKMYNYMIKDSQISGRQLCMILYEQGFFDDTTEYNQLANGQLNPYDFMVSCIKDKRITPGQLALQPCSGAAVMVDPNNGDVLALVSYPSYDNNRLSGTIDADYYYQMYYDKSTPMRNWATQAQSAPGSTFKICTSIMGLDMGIIDKNTSFFCSGTFTDVTPSPRCWVRTGHGTETVATAIRDSCNVFFYSVGYRLSCSKNGQYNSAYGTSVMQKYAEDLGLATPSGIELSESTPSASNVNAIASAIGQGTHKYSALNLARYAATIANSGTCYDLTIIDKVTDKDGNLIRDNSAKVANEMDISDDIWDVVHYGMHLVQPSYAALSRISIPIGAKSGTAQENPKEPDHALMISYAPFDNPEIALAVNIQNGYTGAQAAELTRSVINIYFGLE